MRGNPGRIWKIKGTETLVFSYNKEQVPELLKQDKLVVYITEDTQASLFEGVPPKQQCRKVIKHISTLQLVGFMD